MRGYRFESIESYDYFYYDRYELIGNKDQAIDFYQQLLNFVPSDPSLLAKLSDMADAENDKQQAFSYLTDVRSLSFNNSINYKKDFSHFKYQIKYLKKLINTLRIFENLL